MLDCLCRTHKVFTVLYEQVKYRRCLLTTRSFIESTSYFALLKVMLPIYFKLLATSKIVINAENSGFINPVSISEKCQILNPDNPIQIQKCNQ